jgi:hypothetical protein
MKTKIFTYKGWLGVESSEKAEGIIAKPEGGNLGVVVKTDCCEITPEAKQVFKNAGREGGSFAPFMLTTHVGQGTAHGKSSFGWLGGYLNADEFANIKLGRDCDKKAIDDMIEVSNMTIPEEFKKFVDQEGYRDEQIDKVVEN